MELSKLKFDGVKQLNSKSVQGYNMRYRQFNAVNYTIQKVHSNPTARRLALRTEVRSAIIKYIINLKEEISEQVDEMLRKTVISHSDSPHNDPL